MADLGGDYAAAGRKATKVCLQLVGSRADAEDCAAEAVLEALQQEDKLKHVDSVEGWIVTVAKRRAIDLVRTRAAEQRRFTRLTVAASRELLSPIDSRIEELLDHAEATWLHEEAAVLPATTRKVLACLMQGRTNAETAVELGLSRRAIENHVFRARQHLRATWLSSIAAFVGLLAGLRRFARAAASSPATVPVAALGVVVTMAIVTSPLLQHHPHASPRTAAPILGVAGRLVGASDPLDAHSAQVGAPVAVGLSRAARAPRSSESSRTLVSVHPAGADKPGVRVTQEEHGPPTGGPVDNLVTCVQTFKLPDLNGGPVGC